MEKTTKKPVDRQATFDTDPHRAHLTKGNIKLPVIETQDKDKKKPESVENKSIQAEKKDTTSDKHKGNANITSSKNVTSEQKHKTTVPGVKVDSNIKSNILSNINKKISNDTDKDSKDTIRLKDNSKKSLESNTKNSGNHSNGDVLKKDKGVASETDKKRLGDAKFGVLSKSTSQKISENKAGDKQQTTSNTKVDTNEKKNDHTSKVTHPTNKSVSDSENKSRVNAGNRSRSPEKHQPSKATVLKDLNSKRSESPSKGKHTNAQKETKSSNDDLKNTSQTPKLAKSPQNKVVNSDDKTPKPSPRKQDKIKQTKESNSPAVKGNNRQIPVEISKDTTVNTKSTLPVNNAPAETLLSNGQQNDQVEEDSVKISPRSKNQQRKHLESVELSTKQSEARHSTNENTKSKIENIPVSENHKPEQTVNGVASPLVSLQLNDKNIEQDHRDQTQERNNHSGKLSDSITDSHIVGNEQSGVKENHLTDKILSNSVKSKNETYVLSPSPSKIESKSQSRRVSRPGRLSPSNESVEPIKLEQRPSSDKTGMDIDRREPYAQVFAERNTLLNAEYTYRKRIKQLEDEANGFLKAIDELTTENKYLRSRVDSLEDASRANGGSETVDRITELEKDKASLENKIKELEKSSKATDNVDEMRELKEQVVKLQGENQKLNEENTKLNAEKVESKKKLRALEAEKKSLETSVTDVESVKLDKIQDLNKEQRHLNKQLSEYKTKNQGLEKKVDALEYENKTLSETLAQKKSELNELIGVMKDENKFDNEIKDLKNQILKLNKEKKESELAFNKEKRVLNEKLKDVKTSLETKTKDADELKIKLDQVESEHKKMKVEFDPMKKLVESQKKEITQLKEEIERLKQELKERKEAYAKLECETESASKDLKEAKEQLEQFNKELQKIVSDKESQISKLINQMDTMREERENERKSSKDEKEKLASEMEKVERYQENTRRLESDLKNFVEKLDESKLKEKQLSLQLEDKGFEVSNLEHQVFEMNMKMENYSKRMSELDRQKREMENEKREWEVKKDKIDDIESSNKRLLEENKRLRNQIEMSSYASTYRPPERDPVDKPVVEAWVSEKNSQALNQAIYVQNEKQREHRKKKVHLAQQPSSNMQKKRLAFSKSSPVKVSRQQKHEESKPSNPSTHRSLEDLRKVGDNKTPESEHSLPELKQDARLTVGYGGLVGYREIHKNRIRAAHKKVYPIH